MVKPALKMVGVCKRIKNRPIVEGIDLELAQGRIAALCGGNGAGKSTVLRMVAGIAQPSAGDIYVNGLQWKKDRLAFSGQIGYMPDDYRFSPGLTALEALSFWAALRNVGKAGVTEALTVVGLEEKKHGSVSTFSKGMRQRLLFAQAILAKPPLLIMDEPTNGLDPHWMDEFVGLLRAIRKNGQSVLFSTHQLEVAEETADKVVFMNEGRSRGEDTVANYRARYGTPALYAAFREALK